MQLTKCVESVSDAVAFISVLPSLEELDASSIRLAVVLRLLRAAGWDVFDVSQVVPDYPTGNGKVDFVLVAGSARGTRGPATPQVLVNVQPFGENPGGRHERSLVAQCASMGAPLAALTNGRRWLLLFQAPDYRGDNHRFCRVDLAENPTLAAEELNRYLSKERVASGQAARSAERMLRDQSREIANRQAVLNGWRRMVLGLDPALLELVATAAEQRTGFRPGISVVRRVLRDNRAELMPLDRDHGELLRTETGASRGRPTSFTLLSETQAVSSWSDLLVGVCQMMYEHHPNDFERILEIRGRRLSYFSRSREDVHQPRGVGNTGIYASCHGTAALLEIRARRVVELFGHPADSLAVQRM